MSFDILIIANFEADFCINLYKLTKNQTFFICYTYILPDLVKSEFKTFLFQ